MARLSPTDPRFAAAEQQFGLPSGLLPAFAGQESGFNTDAVSPTGVRGLMQFTRQTGAQYGLNEQNFTDPAAQIQAAAHYVADLLKQTKGNVREAAGRYYGKNHADVGRYQDGIMRRWSGGGSSPPITTRASAPSQLFANVPRSIPATLPPLIDPRPSRWYLEGGANDPNKAVFAAWMEGYHGRHESGV